MSKLISIVSDTGSLISLEKLKNGYQFIKQLLFLIGERKYKGLALSPLCGKM